jgi:hypothetical protein
MKILLLSALLFLSVNCFSQKTSYDNLIGTRWHPTGITSATINHDKSFSLYFTDNNKVQLFYDINLDDPGKFYSYRIDALKNCIIIFFTKNSRIKLAYVDSNTLTMTTNDKSLPDNITYKRNVYSD